MTGIELLRLLRRHHRAISLLGAFVVFVTFLSKEAKRDKLKDLTDGINSAETAFILRTENRRTYRELESFRRDFSEFRRNPTAPFEGGGSVSSGDIGNVDEDLDYLHHLREEEQSREEVLDNVVGLFNKLPEDKNRRERVTSLSKQSEEFWRLSDKLNELEKDYYGRRSDFQQSKNDKTRAARDAAGEKVEATLSPLYALDEKITREMDSTSRDIFRDAESERIKSEENLAWWTTVTILLYVIGWLIGLAGIAIGAREIESVE